MRVFDASSMIYAWDNYPMLQFPGLWEWMASQIETELLMMPRVAYEEVAHKTPDCQIWLDENNELLMKLKDKKKHVHGRCADCTWLSVCGGNFRARAESAGDVWGPDPACYLTDEEISKKED